MTLDLVHNLLSVYWKQEIRNMDNKFALVLIKITYYTQIENTLFNTEKNLFIWIMKKYLSKNSFVINLYFELWTINLHFISKLRNKYTNKKTKDHVNNFYKLFKWISAWERGKKFVKYDIYSSIITNESENTEQRAKTTIRQHHIILTLRGLFFLERGSPYADS